jgi:hypothetical protein
MVPGNPQSLRDALWIPGDWLIEDLIPRHARSDRKRAPFNVLRRSLCWWFGRCFSDVPQGIFSRDFGSDKLRKGDRRR